MPKGSTPPVQDIYKITVERLKGYQLFSDTTIKTVALLAQKQAGYEKYQDFFKDTGTLKPKLFISKHKRGVPVVDVSPSAKKVKGTIVLHLPMANPLDQNQLYHVATIIASNPDYRVIAFGNPSGKPYKFPRQHVSFWQLFSIAFTSHLRPLVAAELEYLNSQNITNAHYVGYSYGAHKAMIEAYYAEQGAVQSITLIDPVAHPRGFLQLVHDFKNTFHPLGEYVNRTLIPSYFKAREDAAKTNHHEGALKRPINIVVGILLRRLDFISMFEKVLQKQYGVFATVAWGTKSELGNDAHLQVSMHEIAFDHPKKIRAMRLKGDKHAFANDIHLYAAIVREAITNSQG